MISAADMVTKEGAGTVQAPTDKKKQDKPSLFPPPLMHHHTLQKVPGRGRAPSNPSLSTRHKDSIKAGQVHKTTTKISENVNKIC